MRLILTLYKGVYDDENSSLLQLIGHENDPCCVKPIKPENGIISNMKFSTHKTVDQMLADMVELAFKVGDQKIKEAKKSSIDAEISDEEMNKIYAIANMEIKKASVSQKGIIPYSYIKSLRHKYPFKRIVNLTTNTDNPEVVFLRVYSNRKIYRELVQDYVTVYDYDMMQLYVANIQNTITLNYANSKLKGYVSWHHEIELVSDFEDFLLECVVYNIEPKLHWFLLNTWAAAAAAPVYPNPEWNNNTPNTFDLAIFLRNSLSRYYALKHAECNNLVMYPELTYDSMKAIISPILGPIAPVYESYIAKHFPDLKILPHDINDGTLLPNSYLAINTCGVLSFVSDVTIEKVKDNTLEYHFDVATICPKDGAIFRDTVENGLKNI